MSGTRPLGFTVIETMLFLAISGLLVVGILAGAGTAINVQRYKDSTNSFLSYVQGEFDKAQNVQNNRSTALACDPAGSISEGNTQPVLGTSPCVIVGRLLTLSSTGKTVTSRPVYASADGSSQQTDIEALVSAKLFTSDAAEQPSTYTPEWDTMITKPKATTPDQWRILIARSPSSGTIRTFVDTTSDPVASMVKDINRTELTTCVDPQGLLTFERRGIVLLKDASGSASVKDAAGGAC